MKHGLIAIMALLCLTNCTNSGRSSLQTERADTRNKSGHRHTTRTSGCVFKDPDTSVCGITLRNAESTMALLGVKTKLEGDSTHFFYSRDKTQQLGLTVHAGDGYNQVSIFHLSYAKESRQNVRQLNLNIFETEKGITLGMLKKDLIAALGTCYVVRDSTATGMTLYYRIALPDDSKTHLLTHHNMPIYYAAYHLKKEHLEDIEFGFEYP